VPGITRYSSYVPFFRLSRAAAFGAGRGERAVASYDEDAVSMAVESARDALAGPAGTDGIRAVAFATTSPPYAEKLNAATVHAALGLPDAAASFELGSSFRAGLSALLVGLDVAGAGRPSLVSAAEVVIGAPGGARESAGGDAAASFVTGPDGESLAVLLGRASATTEVLDAWRLPESRFASHWEERFGAEALAPVLADTAVRALRDAGVEPSELSSAIVDAANPRAAAGLPAALQLKPEQLADPLAASVGRAGAAHAGLLLARALDAASPGDRILVASLADGCDAAVFQVTDRIGRGRPARRVDAWIASKRVDLAYHTYLRWRGILPFEPPRRPDPERPAAPTCGGTRPGSSASWARAASPAGPGTCRPSACAAPAAPWTGCSRSPSPIGPAASPPTPSTTWPIRSSPRWWRRCSTSTTAAGWPARSPTSIPRRSRSAMRSG